MPKPRWMGTTEGAETAARIIVALFNGIGLMRTLDPGVMGAEFLEEAISFVVRANNMES